MFICSFKLNKTRVLSAIAALCLSLTLVFLMLPDPTDSTASAGTVTVKDEQAMVEYLESIGRTVSPQALLIEEITIPETFNEEYEEYNQLQVSCGFDLKKYTGKNVKKYTYKVLNYEDEKEEVVANLLVFEDTVIGGDVSSTALGGFCEGLMPNTEEKASADEQKTEQPDDNE